MNIRGIVLALLSIGMTGCMSVYLKMRDYKAPTQDLTSVPIEINGAQIRILVSPVERELQGIKGRRSEQMSPLLRWRVEAQGIEGVHQKLGASTLSICTEQSLQSKRLSRRSYASFEPMQSERNQGKVLARCLMPSVLEFDTQNNRSTTIDVLIAVQNTRRIDHRKVRVTLNPNFYKNPDATFLPTTVVKGIGKYDPVVWGW